MGALNFLKKILIEFVDFGIPLFYIYFVIAGFFLIFFLLPKKINRKKYIIILAMLLYALFGFLGIFYLLFLSLFAGGLKFIVFFPLFIIYLISMWQIRKKWKIRYHRNNKESWVFQMFIYIIIVVVTLGFMNLLLVNLF